MWSCEFLKKCCHAIFFSLTNIYWVFNMCQALFTPQTGGKGWRERNKIKKEGKGKLKVEGTKQSEMIQSFALSLVYLIGVNLTPILSNVFQSNTVSLLLTLQVFHWSVCLLVRHSVGCFTCGSQRSHLFSWYVAFWGLLYILKLILYLMCS